MKKTGKNNKPDPTPLISENATAGAIVTCNSTLMYSMILVSLYKIIAMNVMYTIVTVHFHAFNFCLWRKWTWRFSGKVYCTCIINVLVYYIWYIFTNCFYILSVYFFKLKSMMVYHDINIWHLCACIYVGLIPKQVPVFLAVQMYGIKNYKFLIQICLSMYLNHVLWFYSVSMSEHIMSKFVDLYVI